MQYSILFIKKLFAQKKLVIIPTYVAIYTVDSYHCSVSLEFPLRIIYVLYNAVFVAFTLALDIQSSLNCATHIQNSSFSKSLKYSQNASIRNNCKFFSL